MRSTTHNRRALVAALLAACVALTAAACGGSSGGGQEAEYAAALSASFQASLAGENLKVDQASADCVGEEVVSVMGVSAFEDAGLTPDAIRQSTDLQLGTKVTPTDEQASQIANGFFDCVDVGTLVVGYIKQSSGAVADEISAEKWDCIAGNVQNSQLLRDSFVQQLLGTATGSLDTSDPAVIKEIIGDCLTLDDLLKLGQAVQSG